MVMVKLNVLGGSLVKCCDVVGGRVLMIIERKYEDISAGDRNFLMGQNEKTLKISAYFQDVEKYNFILGCLNWIKQA